MRCAGLFRRVPGAGRGWLRSWWLLYFAAVRQRLDLTVPAGGLGEHH